MLIEEYQKDYEILLKTKTWIVAGPMRFALFLGATTCHNSIITQPILEACVLFGLSNLHLLSDHAQFEQLNQILLTRNICPINIALMTSCGTPRASANATVFANFWPRNQSQIGSSTLEISGDFQYQKLPQLGLDFQTFLIFKLKGLPAMQQWEIFGAEQPLTRFLYQLQRDQSQFLKYDNLEESRCYSEVGTIDWIENQTSGNTICCRHSVFHSRQMLLWPTEIKTTLSIWVDLFEARDSYFEKDPRSETWPQTTNRCHSDSKIILTIAS